MFDRFLASLFGVNQYGESSNGNDSDERTSLISSDKDASQPAKTPLEVIFCEPPREPNIKLARERRSNTAVGRSYVSYTEPSDDSLAGPAEDRAFAQRNAARGYQNRAGSGDEKKSSDASQTSVKDLSEQELAVRVGAVNKFPTRHPPGWKKVALQLTGLSDLFQPKQAEDVSLRERPAAANAKRR